MHQTIDSSQRERHVVCRNMSLTWKTSNGHICTSDSKDLKGLIQTVIDDEGVVGWEHLTTIKV